MTGPRNPNRAANFADGIDDPIALPQFQFAFLRKYAGDVAHDRHQATPR